MMFSRKILQCFYVILFLSFIPRMLFAVDFKEIVSGGDIEDSLGKLKIEGASPYVADKPENRNQVESVKIKKNAQSDFIFVKSDTLSSEKTDKRKELEDVGYVPPGSFDKKENFIELDKKTIASDFRKLSSSAFNLTFIKNNYDYQSPNNIISRTISEGYKHIKVGALFIHSDQYFYRSDYVNTFWNLGIGVGYNSGRGLFIKTNERSEATFRLWEIPVDAGLGIEIPIYHWLKISGSAGPSATGLYQNRSDFLNGEAGKNKIQVGYGSFANAKFQINLSGFSNNLAYALFSESKITNLFLNLEARYQNYSHFQDEIKISGTSLGIGFTFEYL